MRDHSNHSDPTGGRRRGGVGLDTGPQRRVDVSGPVARGPIDPGMVDITGQFAAIVSHQADTDPFADLDEFEGYDDVTGPLDRSAPGPDEDPDFWVDRTPTTSQRVTETLQAIRAGRTGTTGQIPRTAASNGSHTGRPARSTRPAGRGPRRPRGGAPTARRTGLLSGLPGLDSPFARRVGIIAAVVLLAAPVVSALRPSGADAETGAAQDPATVAVGTAPTTDADAAILLNPGAGQAQTPSATIDMDALPLLTLPGQSTSGAVATQSACAGHYTVVSGDSWSLIADKVSVSLQSLLDVNDATTRTMLHVGDEICLPKGASTPTTSPSTTKSPSTTVAASPTTVAAPSGPYYSPAQVEAIIRDVWPDNLEDTAVMIATRESKLNPYVHNWCCYGLFQIYWEVHDVWLIPRGVTSASQLYDPRTNATVAYWVYQRSGSFAPWGL